MKKFKSQAPAINEQVNKREGALSVRDAYRKARLLGCAHSLTVGVKYAVVYYNGSDVLYSYTDPVQLVAGIHRQMEYSHDEGVEEDEYVEIEDNTFIITEEGIYRWQFSYEHYCFNEGRCTIEQLTDVIFSSENLDREVDMTSFKDEFHPLINIRERRLAL
jgi:hypothetical protein